VTASDPDDANVYASVLAVRSAACALMIATCYEPAHTLDIGKQSRNLSELSTEGAGVSSPHVHGHTQIWQRRRYGSVSEVIH
jgi:hypothetical protein